MASLLNSIPPSTACSAASSCGGWRPKSSVGGGTSIPEWPRSSTTATMRPHLPSSSVERTFDGRYRDCKPGPRRAQPPRRRNCLATANARRCWSGRKATLFMNLWMGCGYLRPPVLRRLGRTCGRTPTSTTSPQLSAPQGWGLSVDDKFIGVSARVAFSGVLCFAPAPPRLTAG